jgi:hypothetical protein
MALACHVLARPYPYMNMIRGYMYGYVDFAGMPP